MCSPSVSSTDFIESSYLGIFKGPAPIRMERCFHFCRDFRQGKPGPGELEASAWDLSWASCQVGVMVQGVPSGLCLLGCLGWGGQFRAAEVLSVPLVKKREWFSRQFRGRKEEPVSSPWPLKLSLELQMFPPWRNGFTFSQPGPVCHLSLCRRGASHHRRCVAVFLSQRRV